MSSTYRALKNSDPEGSCGRNLCECDRHATYQLGFKPGKSVNFNFSPILKYDHVFMINLHLFHLKIAIIQFFRVTTYGE